MSLALGIHFDIETKCASKMLERLKLLMIFMIERINEMRK